MEYLSRTVVHFYFHAFFLFVLQFLVIVLFFREFVNSGRFLILYREFYRNEVLFRFFRGVVDMVLLWHCDVVFGRLALVQVNAVFIGDLGKLKSALNR